MSRAKSLLKNAKRIAECNTPDLSQEPSQDLLVQLKEYRAQSSSKNPSPLKTVSMKRAYRTPTPSKFHTASQHINARTARPGTSPYPDNILAAAKLIEKPMIRSHKLSHDSYYQEKSNDRLYRGARVMIGRASRENYEVEEKTQEHLFTETAQVEFQEYLSSIRMLYGLRFDLEMNYEVVRGEASPAQHSMLGDYFSLQEKLEESLKNEYEEIKNISTSEFLKVIQEYNRIVRHILMGLKLKKQDNEATIVEMLWRTIIKLLDNALILHERSVFDLNEMMKLNAKKLLRDYTEKYDKAVAEFGSLKDAYDQRIEKLQEQTKIMQTSIAAKDQYISERDKRMNELLEINNRDKSCIDMSRILKKLNSYISETEDQQYKQVLALSEISDVMRMAEKFDRKPETTSQALQSDLSLPCNPFPELRFPKMSNSVFYYLFRDLECVNRDIVLKDLNAALDECTGEETYYAKYGEYLVRTYNSTEDIQHALRTTGCFLLTPSCIKSRLFARLLGFPRSLDKDFEKGLLKVCHSLSLIDSRSPEGLLPLCKLIETFQLILPGQQQQIQTLLSSLKPQLSFSIDLNQQLWVLLSRFYFALEKTKKPFRFHLEGLDSKKEGVSKGYVVTSFQFVEWIRSKLTLWMKEEEIVAVVDYFGGEIMRVQNVIERFAAAKLEKCREIFVSKEEVMLGLIAAWQSAEEEQVQSSARLAQCGSFSEFTEELGKMDKTLNDPQAKSAYFELLSGASFEKIAKRYKLINLSWLNVEEIKRLEKKRPRKIKSVSKG